MAQTVDPAINQSSGFTARIARSFLLLAMLSVALVGAVAYGCGRKALADATYSQLNMIATLKQKEITRWLESCEEDFLLIAEFPTVTTDIQVLFSEPADSAVYQAAYSRVSDYFAEIKQNKPKFTELSIQNKANQIILSTNPDRVGTYEISANLTVLESVVAGENFAPNFYVSPQAGGPAITYASKFFDVDNSRQGMLLADLNLKRIDDIISEHSGLAETGETYLVGSLLNQPAFLARPDTLLPPPDGPMSLGIERAFRAQNGEGVYQNYAGQTVIGVYRWLAGQDIALLAEIERAEAFAPARALATTIVVVSLGATAILLLGVGRLARQLSASRQQIETYSQQLEKTADVANSANRAKSEFLANMSHELRTPLNAILGFTQLMRRESRRYAFQSSVSQSFVSQSSAFQASTQNEYLGIISRSGEQLLNLINDVLSMSKIEAGRTTFAPVCFDLRYLLLTLEEMLRMRAESKAIQLRVDIDPQVPQFIKTDEVKLRQVLVNLVGNAI
ncbi:MAG: sensor histidine kinase [Phormidesmis sp.]